MKTGAILAFILGFLAAVLLVVLMAILPLGYGIYRETIDGNGFTRIAFQSLLSSNQRNIEITLRERSGDSSLVIKVSDGLEYKEVEVIDNSKRTSLQLWGRKRSEDRVSLFIAKYDEAVLEYYRKNEAQASPEKFVFGLTSK